jgi:hypothetical protein
MNLGEMFLMKNTAMPIVLAFVLGVIAASSLTGAAKEKKVDRPLVTPGPAVSGWHAAGDSLDRLAPAVHVP